MRKTKVLIIGLGRIGVEYDLGSEEIIHSHAGAFARHNQFEIVGGVDRDLLKRKQFEQRYLSKSYQEIGHALLESRPDLAIIATPTETHAKILFELISRGSTIKHILCEKPLSYNYIEARKMVEACDSSNISLHVNYMRRSETGVLKIKKMINNQVIREPIKSTVWYTKGAIHNGSHYVNLFSFWLGEPLKSGLISAGLPIDSNDIAADFWIQYKKGLVVFLNNSEELFTYHNIEIIGENGRLMYKNGGRQIDWIPIEKSLVSNQFLELEPVDVGSEFNIYQYLVAEEMHKFITHKPHNLCDGFEALRTLEVISKIKSQA